MLWGEDKEMLLKFGEPRQLGGGLAWNEAGAILRMTITQGSVIDCY